MKKIIAGCLGLVMVLATAAYGAELSWETGATLPQGLAFAPACVHNGKVYVAGGLKSSSKITLEIKNSWQGAPSLEMPTTDWYALNFIDTSTNPDTIDFKNSLDYHPTDYYYTSLLDYEVPSLGGTLGNLMESILGIEIKTALPGAVTYYYTYQNEIGITLNASDKVYVGHLDAAGKVTNWTELNSLPSPSLNGALAAGKAENGNDYLYSVGGSITEGTTKLNLVDLSVGTAVTQEGLADTPANREMVYLGRDMASSKIPGVSESSIDKSNSHKVYRAEINTDGTIGTWVEDMPLLSPTTPFYGTGYNAYIRDNKLCLIDGFGMPADVDFSDAMVAVSKIMPYLSAGLSADISADGSLGEWQTVENVLGSGFPIFPLFSATMSWNEDNFYLIGGLTCLGEIIDYLLQGGPVDVEVILEVMAQDLAVPETYRIPFANGFPLQAGTTTEAAGMLAANYPPMQPQGASCAVTNHQICLTGGIWELLGGMKETFPSVTTNLEADFSPLMEVLSGIVGASLKTDTYLADLDTAGDIPNAWEKVGDLPAGALGGPMVTDGEHFVLLGGLSALPIYKVAGDGYGAGTKFEANMVLNNTALTLGRSVGTLSGTVTNSTGTPLSDVSIKVTGKEYRIVKTDTQGKYSLELPVGIYNLTADFSAQQSKTYIKEKALFYTVKGIEIKKDEVTQRDIILPPLGTLSGVARDSADNPLSEVRIGAIKSEGGWLGNVYGTDTEGKYLIELPTGTYNLIASYYMSEYKRIMQQIEKIEIKENETTTCDLVLPLYGKITGTVKDKGGKAISARLNFAKQHESFGFSADINGNYEFELPPGIYDVEITPPSSSNLARFYAQDLRIESATTTVKNFILSVKGGIISGTVKDSEGNPVKNAWVSLHFSSSDNEAQECYAQSDANGKYKIDRLAPGDYYLKVDPPYQYENIYSLKRVENVPIVSGKTTLLDVKFETGGKIKGKITNFQDLPSGTTCAYMVYALGTKYSFSQLNISEIPAFHGFVDTTGNYEFSLPEGNYNLYLFLMVIESEEPELISLVRMDKISDFSVKGSSTVVKNFTAELGKAALSGEITTSDGGAIQNGWVFLLSAVTKELIGATGIAFPNSSILTKGRYNLSHIPEGDYIAVVLANGYPRLTEKISLTDKTIEKDFILNKGVKISGKVTDADGTPIAGALVTISGLRVAAITDSEGKFSLEGVMLGKYRIVAKAVGCAREEKDLIIDQVKDYTLNFELSSAGEISGKVFLAGAGFSGAKVIAFTSEGIDGYAVSDSTGDYLIPNLKLGEYKVAAIAEGYLVQPQEITLTSENPGGTVDFNLSKDDLRFKFAIAPIKNLGVAIIVRSSEKLTGKLSYQFKKGEQLVGTSGDLESLTNTYPLIFLSATEGISPGDTIKLLINGEGIISGEGTGEFYFTLEASPEVEEIITPEIGGEVKISDADEKTAEGEKISDLTTVELKPGAVSQIGEQLPRLKIAKRAVSEKITEIAASKVYRVNLENATINNEGIIRISINYDPEKVVDLLELKVYRKILENWKEAGVIENIDPVNCIISVAIKGKNILASSAPSSKALSPGGVELGEFVVLSESPVFTKEVYTGETFEAYNYPNPFYPKDGGTIIKYSIPGSGSVEVSIKIYTIAGELVKDFGEFEKEAGNSYTDTIWYGKNDDNVLVASGIYLMFIKAGNDTLVKKIALIK